MIDNLKLIIQRNEFYRKNYHQILFINILLVITICLLVGYLKLQASIATRPQYFPTTPDGVVIQSPPNTVNHLELKNFNFSDKGVLTEWPEVRTYKLDLKAEDSNQHAVLKFWATNAILAMFDLDFVNYRAALQNIRKNFTAKGYDRFLSALHASKNLDTIKNGRRVAFAQATDKAKVTKTGVLEGHRVWEVVLPIVVTYENPKEEPLTQKLLAVIRVARVSTLKSRFYGLAIFQVNFKTGASS